MGQGWKQPRPWKCVLLLHSVHFYCSILGIIYTYGIWCSFSLFKKFYHPSQSCIFFFGLLIFMLYFFIVYPTIICFFKVSLAVIHPLMHPSVDLHCLVFYSFLIYFCTLTTIKGMTEDEMVGWHHRLHGHEFEQAPGVGDGQGSLARCSAWGCKELDTTERLHWTELPSF